jgi:integrase
MTEAAQRVPAMGRTTAGVEVRAKSIRLSFTMDGTRQRHTLTVNGKPMSPTPANVKDANRLIVEICECIRAGTFSLIEYFPASGTPTSLTVSDWLGTWLNTQRVEASTKAGYESTSRFWCAAVCDWAQ